MSGRLDAERLRKMQIANEKALGRLIERRLVEDVVFSRFRAERDAWSAWPMRVAPVLAARFGCDAVELGAALEGLVRDHLADLAARPLELGHGP